VRPLPDLVGGGQADADLVEEVHIKHVACLLSLCLARYLPLCLRY
jgi:hypothetical protein